MPSLKLYYDLMSQPSRALYIFLRMNRIPFEEKELALRKGDHLTEEYTRINPSQLVPVIDDSGFILTESVAILKYLCKTRPVSANWYPVKTPQETARVDEFLASQHTTLRLNAAQVFRTKVIEPRAKQIPVNQEKVQRFKAGLDKALTHMENYYLKDNQYLCGDDITVADLLAVCELMQPSAAGEDIFQGHDKLKEYVDRVTERLQPHFDEAHQWIFRLRDKMAGEKSAKI